jgi:hypothetical protein
LARSRRADQRRKRPLLGVNRTKSPRGRIDEIDLGCVKTRKSRNDENSFSQIAAKWSTLTNSGALKAMRGNICSIAFARPGVFTQPRPICMVRPCVARGFRRDGGERSCINVSGLWLERVVLRAIMDISARAISLADRPRRGHLGHQCSHAPGRPILHLVSSSRRPRRVRSLGSSPAHGAAGAIFLASKLRP